MAGVATGDVFDRAHLVRFFERVAERDLVVINLAVKNDIILTQRIVDRLLVTHIENLLTRAQILFGVAMAVEAELHLQRRKLIHQRHLVNRTMAGVAAYPFSNVNAVVEIYIVRQLVDAGPFQRVSRAEAFADRLQIRRIGPNLRMAVHAGLSRRNAGEARSLNRCVTVAAIDAEAADVMLMTKRNWLRLSDAGIGNKWSALQFRENPE